MGYTISRASVTRNKEQLEQLLKMKTTLVFRDVANPQKLAYKLREAIAAAAHYDEFKHLAWLSTMYTFRTGVREVIAQYEILDIDPTIPMPERPGAEVEMPSKSIPIPEKKTIPDAQGIMEVVGYVLKFPREQEIHFPNAVLMDEDRLKLHKWTQEQDWKYIDHDEGGLTLTKRDIPKEVLWQPES